MSHLLTVGSISVKHNVLNSVLNVKVLVGAFNQEKACDCKASRNLREGSFEALVLHHPLHVPVERLIVLAPQLLEER